jgi:hypothetical protein
MAPGAHRVKSVQNPGHKGKEKPAQPWLMRVDPRAAARSPCLLSLLPSSISVVRFRLLLFFVARFEKAAFRSAVRGPAMDAVR